MGRTFKIILPGITPVSWNKFYRAHWTKQSQMKKDFEQLIWAYTPRELRNLCIKNAHVEIWAYFKSDKRGSKYYWIDADNLCGKPILDGIKGAIVDDDPRYIHGVSCYSRLDPNNPRTEIIIKTYAKNNNSTLKTRSQKGRRTKRDN